MDCDDKILFTGVSLSNLDNNLPFEARVDL